MIETPLMELRIRFDCRCELARLIVLLLERLQSANAEFTSLASFFVLGESAAFCCSMASLPSAREIPFSRSETPATAFCDTR